MSYDTVVMMGDNMKFENTVVIEGDVFIRTPEGEWVDPSTGEEYTLEELDAIREQGGLA